MSKTDFLQIESRFESDISLKCRGCLTEEPDMRSLFAEFEKNTTLAKLIEESIGYKITEEEQFSEYLCKECTKIIVDFVRFQTTFREATAYFENLNTKNISQNTNGFNVEEVNNDSKNEVTISPSKIECKLRTKPDKTEYIWERDSENSDNFADDLTEVYEDQSKESRHKSKDTRQQNCELCDARFGSKVQLQRHKRTLHRENSREGLKKKQVSAKDILEKSSEESDGSVINLNTRLKESSTDPNSMKLCRVCRQEFPAEEFEYHLDTHKTHICNTCGHKFIRKTDLNDHIETHLDVCKYVCQHCGKAFKVRTALNKHKRIHTNPREEICDICGQRFNTRDTLKTHCKLKHIKSKDFQCNLCGLAFTLKSTLEKHIERHNPNRQRKYSCNLCNVSYINKYNLSRHHIIKHTAFENRPICEFCGKGYIKKTDLVKHVKRHHGQNGNQGRSTKEMKLEND